jgi:hypothetical protein
VVNAYNLRPLEKSCYRARCFFTLKRSLEIMIDNNRQKSWYRARSLSLSMIFNFGKNFHNVGSLALCLRLGTSPGAIFHTVSISKRKFNPSPAALPCPWAVSHAQIDTGLTRDLCCHSPTARSRGVHQH